MIKWFKNLFKKAESDIRIEILKAKNNVIEISDYITSIETKYNKIVSEKDAEIAKLKSERIMISNIVKSEIVELPKAAEQIADTAETIAEV